MSEEDVALSIPDGVVWTADGFSLTLPRSSFEATVNGIALVSIALGMVAALGVVLSANEVLATELLPIAVRTLLALAAGLLGFVAVVASVGRRGTITVGVSGFLAQVGSHRVPAEELRDCELRGDQLVVSTARRRLRVELDALTVDERSWLRDQFRELRSRWSGRAGTVPAGLKDIRRQATDE